jgi:gas vesicle protein
VSLKDFVLGLLAGTLTGILISPRAGRETRERVRHLYSEIKDQVIGKAASIKEITRETYENIVDSVVEGYQSAKKLTSSEAAEIKAELKAGYHKLRDVFTQARQA